MSFYVFEKFESDDPYDDHWKKGQPNTKLAKVVSTKKEAKKWAEKSFRNERNPFVIEGNRVHLDFNKADNVLD